VSVCFFDCSVIGGAAFCVEGKMMVVGTAVVEEIWLAGLKAKRKAIDIGHRDGKARLDSVQATVLTR